MNQTTIKLSDTARAVLEHAVIRTDHLVRPPALPAAARQNVVRSLLNRGLVQEVPASITDGAYAWRTGEDGVVLMLRATPIGLAVIGLAEAPTAPPTLPDAATEDAVAREAAAVADALDAAPTAPARATVRMAAQVVLDAWNDEANRETDIIGALEGPMAALRTAFGARIARPVSTGPRPARTGTKQEAVLAMLRRSEGATVAQIAEATDWASHYADARIMPM